MTQQQFIEEIKRLSVTERISLIEVITNSLREELEPHKEATSTNSIESDQAAEQSPSGTDVSLSQRLYGILKFDGDPPTDEELKDDYANYLLEKYS